MSDPSARIISHMNNDHQLSLNDYVVIYGRTDFKTLIEDSVQITEIDPEHIVLEFKLQNLAKVQNLALYWSDAQEYENITVKSWSDLKGKLIAMAKYCADKRGLAVKKLTKVEAPSILGPAAFESLRMYPQWALMLLNAYDPNIISRAFANDFLLNKVSCFLPTSVFAFYHYVFEKHVSKLIAAYIIGHLIEIVFFTRPILKKHRAPTNVRVKWYLLNMVEGFPVLLRLKNLTKD